MIPCVFVALEHFMNDIGLQKTNTPGIHARFRLWGNCPFANRPSNRIPRRGSSKEDGEARTRHNLSCRSVGRNRLHQSPVEPALYRDNLSGLLDSTAGRESSFRPSNPSANNLNSLPHWPSTRSMEGLE
jgi:hypothetical protein